ncbi:Diaminopimelate epimerase [gamma proteobacterium HdN1]|nr:Diaminopimelate epimerase [gamma proteobacterium HdN1]
MQPIPTPLAFTKMHGLGNDFMVLDATRAPIHLDSEQIRRLADRHFGVGFDQLLVVESATNPEVDFNYRIFNADGGEVEQCGNGARCFARFVHEKGLTQKNPVRVSTKAGIIQLNLQGDFVQVDMGVPKTSPKEIPFSAATDEIFHFLKVGDQTLTISVVNMGNPHAVLQVSNVETAPVAQIGPMIESHPSFPARVNVGFMEVVSRNHIKLRVFERGAGETLACGTGACAAAVAGIRAGLLDSPVKVELAGGELQIQWAGIATSVIMEGPATKVYEGFWG